MIPENDEQFVAASKAIATAFLDKFATIALPPEDVANLCGAALSEIMAQQLGPWRTIERLRDMADAFERQILELKELG